MRVSRKSSSELDINFPFSGAVFLINPVISFSLICEKLKSRKLS